MIKKCDWPQSPDWTNEFYEWLNTNAKSYDSMESEVSQILGYKWHMLSHTEFENLEINLNSNKIY